jgi:signal transduction histidine kinase/CheY-like chemotaxis protein/predicted transcriptional regulator
MAAKKFIYYILAGFVLGTLFLIYIQFNSWKNINKLIAGNEKLLSEFKVSSELKDLENDVITVESKIQGTVTTKDTTHIEGLEIQIQEIENGLNQLQKISDDDNSVKYIDELDNLVRQKLKFSHQILDSFHIAGKTAAESLIATEKGKNQTDSISDIIQKIDSIRKILSANVTLSVDKSGKDALRFSTILIALVLFSGAVLFWYIINTIRRQIQLIADLNISEKKVKQAAQVKENCMANMSHEIRTPMNAILGFTNLLQKKKLDDESKRYVQTIQKSGENLLIIVNDILDLSKIEAGMMRIESAPFSIRGLLHSVETMFKGKANEKQLQLSTIVDDSLPDSLEGDAARLTQILVNLIGNALKFTQTGSITISITNEGQKSNIVNTGIVISDTGIGIANEKLHAVFERFQQADDAVTRKYGGTGLGLSIVRDLVLLQNGTIRVESERGKGTIFHITIPYKIATEEIKDSFPEECHAASHANFKDTYILLVEDNEINQSLILHLFKSWNLLYDLAINGKEAVEILQAHPGKYNLVLMDIQMAEMDGYTATQHIRHQLKLNIPIIAMTAHVMAGEREKCITYGMNEYISKPIREEQLHNLISRFAMVNIPAKPQSKQTAFTINKPYQYINLEYMKEVSGGNIEYEKTVTQQFIEAIPEDLLEIEKTWKQNDITAVRQLAHNMKTTVSVMGLNDALQPHLDTMEYDNLTEQNFQHHLSSLISICNKALGEAKEFYATF